MNYTLPLDTSVDIHLRTGLLIRGKITQTVQDVVIVEHAPAIHQDNTGGKRFSKVYIKRDDIVAVGVGESN